MTIRFTIAAAALGLVLATGLASAQTGGIAPTTTQTKADVGVTAPAIKAPAKVVKVAHKQHRPHVSHRMVRHAKVAHRSIRAKLAHEHVAKAHLVGARKHAANIKKTPIVR